LRKESYSDAILHALDEMEEYVKGGPQSRIERMEEMLRSSSELIIMALFFGVFYAIRTAIEYKDRKERQEYAIVQSQLSRIDRDAALALQGQYQCTSCAICLEEFPPNRKSQSTSTQLMMPPTIGSDGLPLKLLRCGHAFDDTCWKEWISNGSNGDVRSCPICKQDIGTPASLNIPSNITTNGNQDGNGLRQRQVDSEEHIYTRERNFRLIRLASRYPRVIRPAQIRRWTQSNYQGSLVRDETFMRDDPIRRMTNKNLTTRSRGYSSFGGGQSSGGRGGRW